MICRWVDLFVVTEEFSAKEVEGQEIMREVEDMIEPDCKDPFDGSWSVMYMRLRFEAVVA